MVRVFASSEEGKKCRLKANRSKSSEIRYGIWLGDEVGAILEVEVDQAHELDVISNPKRV